MHETPVVAAATSDRWADLERLFGPNGADSGCWCMYWRRDQSYFADGNRFQPWRELPCEVMAQNRDALHALVHAGSVPGLLAYLDGEPIGWCAVGPRSAFARLQDPKFLGGPADPSVWCVVCFFIHQDYRRRGVAAALLDAAVQYAVTRGATAIEGYPRREEERDVDYTGTPAMFRAAGFLEVARPGWRRVIMRRPLT